MRLLELFNELTLHPKNADELKGLILQLAIEGKLTVKWREEHSNVECASFLFVKVVNEKQRLIQDRKIKNEKPLPIIEESEIPFELPISWVWCRLGDSGYTQTGSTPPTNNQANYGEFIPFIGPADISNQWMKYPKEGLSEAGIAIGRLIPKNSILMVCIGGSIGKCNINEVDVSCNQQINTITPIYNLSVFIRTICQSRYFQNEIIAKSSGSATPIINKGKWENIIIPLPPLEEQKAIVEVVNQLFVEVDQLEEHTKARIKLKQDFVTSALHKLSTENNILQEWTYLQKHFSHFFTEKASVKKLRETLLQLAVQGKLTHHWRKLNSNIEPASELLKRIEAEKQKLIKEKKIKKENPIPTLTDDEKPYELPDGWIWCRLTELVDVGTGSTPSKSNSAYYHNGTIPWYTSSATSDNFAKVQDAMITQKALNETNCKVFPKGSLIIALYGQGKTRGQISELVTPGATNQAIAGMVFFNSSKLVKDYLKYFFQKIYHEIRLLAEGGAQPNLNVGKIKSTLIPLPTENEILVIVEKVNSLMIICDELEKQIEISNTQVEQLMQSCLKELFQY